VSHNIIFRSYDEALDLAGSDILVVNNYAGSGRIGITIGGGTNIVVDGNIVEQHIHGGFNVSAKRRAIFSHNIVKDSSAEAYQLTGFDVIDSNRAEGNNRIGFKIADMHGGVIRENLALNSGIGFNLVRSNANLVYRNEYLGEGKDAVVFDKHSHENHTLEDRQFMSGDSPSGAARPYVSNGSPRASSVEQITSTAEKQKILESLVGHSLDIDRGRPDHSKFQFHVKGESEGDIKVAKALADFLAPHNPGFLSIDVQGYRFRSQIAPDLGTTLKEAGDLAIGVVRMPIKILRAQSRTLFPVWHLSVGEKEVGIVTLSLSGPGARILVTEEGSLNVERRLILFVAHAAYLFRSFYYTGGKLLVGVTVIVVFSTGGWLLWRFKKRMAHRKI
jgi:hypothetical protein